MVKFSIDYINSASFFKKLDYSNKIILSSTADTLFIYDREKNKYILNACESFKVYNNKYLFNLRKDIYYYDGTRVTAHDYVKAIIEQQQLIPEFFINVLSINSTDTTIFIVLKKKDKKFINKLSYFLHILKKLVEDIILVKFQIKKLYYYQMNFIEIEL